MTFYSLRRSVILAVIVTAVGASLAWAQEADLLVSKSGPAQAPANSDVTYIVTVTNLGPDASSAVTLTDPIPAGMTFVSAVADPAFSCSTPAFGSGGTITCSATTLAALASASFTFVFHIPGATPPGTTFVNIATAASATDSSSENDSGIAATSTPPPPQADMGVGKIGPSAVGPNTDVAFTITVTNAGPDAAANVSWQDTLPGSMTFVSLVPTGGPAMVCTTPSAGAGGTIACTATTFAAGAGATATFTLTGHIPSGTPSGTTFNNTATVSTTTADPSSENNTSTAPVLVSSVDVSVAKAGPGTVTAGDTVSYALLIANGGPDTAVNVQFNDPLPPNTTFVSLTQNTGPLASCSTPAPNGTGIVTCVFATLASGVSAEFTLVIRAGNTTSITNTASATTDSFDTDHTNDTASATTTVIPSADVGVTKNGPATATAGANVAYTVTVTNGGPSTAATVSLTDTLPPNTTFVSITQTVGPTFTCLTPAVGSAGTITCTIATLAPGASATFSIVLRPASSTPGGGSVSNTATITTTTTDPTPANNTSTTTATLTVSADVSVTKSGPASVAAGSNATYTVTVTNHGPSDAASVSLADTLPPATTFVSESQTSGPLFTCATPAIGGTGTITCTITTLAAGASATFDVVLKVLSTAAGPINNTASVSATTSDPVPGNGSSTASTPVTGGPTDVAITKTGSVGGPNVVGTSINYTIVVTNLGPAVADNIVVTDVLPAGATLTSFVATQGSCAGTSTVTCAVGSLPSGGSATITLVVALAQPTGTISNTATVTSANVDPNPANNSSSADVVLPTAIPTLSPLTFALLGLTLATVGFFVLRGRQSHNTR